MPSRWHGCVLACTHTTLSAREVVERYMDLLMTVFLSLEKQRLDDLIAETHGRYFMIQRIIGGSPIGCEDSKPGRSVST